jgi:hypothetical protein
MRVAAGGRTDALITSTRGPSVYGIANKGGRLREVGIFNTTATAFAVALVRASAAGTVGTAMTEVIMDNEVNSGSAQLTAFNTHTANATVGSPVRQSTIGAAAGAGVIWTFGDEGLIIPTGTANGIVIILPVGTAQHFDFYFEWQE